MGGQLRTCKANKSSIYSILLSSYGILRTRANKATADIWSAINFRQDVDNKPFILQSLNCIPHFIPRMGSDAPLLKLATTSCTPVGLFGIMRSG